MMRMIESFRRRPHLKILGICVICGVCAENDINYRERKREERRRGEMR